MATLKGLASIVRELRAGRTDLVDRLRHVDAALSVLGKLHGGSSHTLSASTRKRTISAAGKKRIAAAQRARWAKVRAAKKAG